MKKLHLQLHEQSCGRSMVEMLGVLAIVGVLSVGAIAGYSKAMMKHKINKTTDQISQIVANIRTAYSSQGDYEGLNYYSAIQLGIFSDEILKNYNTNGPRNLFNGLITFASCNTTEDFVIHYDNLPTEACIALATADWGSAQDGLIAVGVGITSLASVLVCNPDYQISLPHAVGVADSETHPTPISVEDAVDACSETDLIKNTSFGLSLRFK